LPALLKYSFLALGNRLWYLAIYLLFSLTSHLFAPALPEFLRQSAMLGVWFLLSVINIMIFMDVVFFRGNALASLQYQQSPQKPGKLITSHLMMVCSIALLFIASWVSFYPFAYTLLPGGVTLPAIANIFAFSLYFGSISLIILMLAHSFLAAAGNQFGAALLGFLTIILAIYLLIFHADLNPSGLVTAPIADLTEGAAIAGGSLLQTPWNVALRNIFITTSALILQYIGLTYLLNGRIDMN
jgi:hypothetical protein